MKKILFNHWEKLLLVLAVAVFFANYFSLRSISEDEKVTDAVKAWTEINGAIENKPAQPLEVPDFPDKIDKVWAGVNSVRPEQGLILALDKPVNVNITAKEEGPVQPLSTLKKHIPPQLSAVAAPGSVTVSWTPDPANEAAVDSYALYRKTNENDLAIIGNFLAGDSSFEDKSVLPNTAYQYRIIAQSVEIAADYPEVRSEWCQADSAQDFDMEFTGSGNAKNQDEADSPKYLVQIKIVKHLEGKKYTEEFYIKKGEGIGLEKHYNKDPVTGQPFINPDTKKPEKITVNYSTGYTMKGVKIDDKGNEILIFTDDKGAEHTLGKKKVGGN
ncbi:MAG: fibronectin type III domain-containing protein [Planctomycetes bacterium]|nr:fibronectin type III domain-containing protein [Planctomycetota bacterium]